MVRHVLRREPGVRTERLPFTVKVAESEDELREAVSVRHAAYARHLPQFAAKLAQPEPDDLADDVVVLVAKSNIDGEALGTLRIHNNRHRPLPLEASVSLPAMFSCLNLVEATRLSVGRRRESPVVKAALFKAFFLYCLHRDDDLMVATGRSPIDRMYESLLFKDTFVGGPFLPMAHVGDIPHRVMHFDIKNAQARWAKASHPLYGFVFETEHPDIDVGVCDVSRTERERGG